MKTCPECGRVFDAAAPDFICPDDSTPLVTFSRDDALVGQVIAGRFEVEAMLGAGGMGAVYRARQLSVDRLVALKVLKRDILDDQQAVRRFFLEAKATSRLSNPHTVTVHDFGQTDEGLLFIAMEYLDGVDLRERLRGTGHIPASEAVSIIDAVAESLAEAHSMEIIHRDLKPENIFLVRRGESHAFVKVLDFGIARAQTLTGDQGLTKTGAIAGTPSYMSPEMVKGEKVGAAADIYAMGVILYEMISGRQPIDGTTPFMVMQRHLTQMPSPLHEELDLSVVPKLLSQFVQRCLSKDPSERPQDARAFRDELARSYEGTPTQPAMAVPVDRNGNKPGDEVALLQTQRATSEQIRATTDNGMQATAAKLHPLNTIQKAQLIQGEEPKKSSGKLIAAIAAVLCVGVGAFFALSSGDAPTQTTNKATSKSAVSAPAPDAATKTPAKVEADPATDPAGTPPEAAKEAAKPVEAPPAKPTNVSISVTTTPPGAEIKLGDQVMGKTPTLLKIPRSDDAVTVTVSLDGHVPRDLMFLPSEDRLLTANLTPMPSAAPKAETKTKAKAKRPQRKKRTSKAKNTSAKKPAVKKAAPKPKPKGKKRFNVLFDD